ncbi:MAG: RNA-guided endonuclease TnpB family protein [Bacteroidales bacterium]|nr:RNA-guided endonuclease TnpB family protein [Bacteroidales bacterium]
MFLRLKIRLYPNIEQETLIKKTIGCCRQIYNIMLASRLDFFNNNIRNKSLSKEERIKIYKKYKAPTERELKQKYEYMKGVSAVALQQASRHLMVAFNRYFKGISTQPKFHSKKHNNSFTVLSDIHFCWDNRTLQITKLGKVKFKNRSLPLWLRQGYKKICNVTVIKTPSNQYYASILFEVEEQPKLKSENQTIGLDFSPADEYVDSNGLSGRDFGYIPQRQKHLKQLRKLQRRLTKKKEGSRNREKARLKFARLEQHIANSRRDWIEKESLRLVRTYNVIGIEDLTTKNLIMYSKNARNYLDTSWGTFAFKLVDKSTRHKCVVIKADRFFASSKLCHICGYKKIDMSLKTRHWVCPVCHTEHNRDVNAAINLKLNAIKILSEGQEFRSAEGVEEIVKLALNNFGASNETEKEIS